jgi:hypothetical protein
MRLRWHAVNTHTQIKERKQSILERRENTKISVRKEQELKLAAIAECNQAIK